MTHIFQKIAVFTLLYVPLRFADVGTCIKILLETFFCVFEFQGCFFASYLGSSEQTAGVY